MLPASRRYTRLSVHADARVLARHQRRGDHQIAGRRAADDGFSLAQLVDARHRAVHEGELVHAAISPWARPAAPGSARCVPASPRVTRPTASSSTRSTSSDSFVCSAKPVALPPLRKPNAPPSTRIASAGPVRRVPERLSRVRVRQARRPYRSARIQRLPVLVFFLHRHRAVGDRTTASRSRRLSPSATTAFASKRNGVVVQGTRRDRGGRSSSRRRRGRGRAPGGAAAAGAAAGGSTSGGAEQSRRRRRWRRGRGADAAADVSTDCAVPRAPVPAPAPACPSTPFGRRHHDHGRGTPQRDDREHDDARTTSRQRPRRQRRTDFSSARASCPLAPTRGAPGVVDAASRRPGNRAHRRRSGGRRDGPGRRPLAASADAARTQRR